MPGISFDATLNNTAFINSANGIIKVMNRTAAVVKSVGGNFNIDGVVNQYVALTKAIQGNEAAIKASQVQIIQWREEAEKAREAGDFTTFQNKSLAIEDAVSNISQLNFQTERYKDALTDVIGLWNGMGSKSPSLLFASQDEYDKVQNLKLRIAELQAQIGNFNGSEKELQGLKDELSGLNDELRKNEEAAANNALQLGSAGEKAAQITTRYYEMTEAIRKQEQVYAELIVKRNQAEAELKEAQKGGDTQAIDDARAKFDALSDAAHNAKQSLVSIRQEQTQYMGNIQKMSQDTSNASSDIVSAFKNIAAVAGISFGLNEAKNFVEQVVEMRSYFQDIESSMKVFLGSQEAGAAFTQKLKDYAYYNMFEFADLAKASQQMIAYGNDVDTIIPKIDQLSNVAVGTHGSLMELVDAYNRAKSTGVVDARGIQSWAVKGVMIRDTLKEMGEEAVGTSITFEQLNKVLDKVTGEGGMFHNLQLEMMENISAEIGQFQDNIDSMLNEIGEKYQDVIVKAIKLGSELVDNYEKIGKLIMDAVAIYGAYRAALMAANVAEGVHLAWKNRNLVATGAQITAINAETASKTANTIATRILTAANTALNASFLSSPYLLIGAAIGAAVFSIYKLVTAEDAETAARRRANEQMDEFKKKLDDQKNRINGYIQTLQDGNATEYEKAVAWENLSKEATTLTEKYDRQTLATMELAEAQKKVNEEMEDAEFAGIGRKLELLHSAVKDIKKGYNSLSAEQKAVFEEAGYENTMAGFSGAQKEKVSVYIEELTNAYEEIRKRRDAIAKEAQEKAIPIEILVKEANENIQTKQEILDFYDKAMVLAKEVEDANNDIDYQAARNNFADFVKEVEEGVEQARKDMDEHPGEWKFKVAYEEKQKIYDAIAALKETMHSDGLDTVWFNIKLNVGGLRDQWEAAKAGLKNLWDKLSPRLHREGSKAVANKEEDLRTQAERRRDAYESLLKAQQKRDELENKKLSDDEYRDELQKINNEIAIAKKAYEDAGGNLKKSEKLANENATFKQKLFDIEQKRLKEQAEQEQATRAAIEKARIAQIKDAGKRQRAEEDEQHRLNMQAIDNREREMKEKLLEQKRQEWEASKPKDSKQVWADTEWAKNGIAAIKTSSDLAKKQKEILESANKEAAKLSGVSVVDENAVAKGKNFIGGIIEMLEKIKEKEQLVLPTGGAGGSRLSASMAVSTMALDVFRDSLKDVIADEQELSELGISQEFIARLESGTISAEELASTIDVLKKTQEGLNKAQREYDIAPKLTKEQESLLEAERAVEEENRARQFEERQRAERQAQYDLLKQWGDYEQQKWAITHEYEEKIREAASSTERAALALQRNEAVEKLNIEQMQEQIDWSGVFADLEGHTEEYLVGLREQLQSLLDSGNLPIDQMATIQEKIREINGEIQKQGGMFNFVGQAQQEHNRRVQAAADAQKELNAAEEELGRIIRENGQAEMEARNLLLQNGIDSDIDLDDDVKNLFAKDSDEYKQIEQLLDKMRIGEGNLAKARDKTAKATQKASQTQDAADESLDESIARHLANINEWVQTYLGDLPALLDEIGLGSVGEKVSQGLSAVNNAAGAAADFASGNYVGAALKAVSAAKDFGRVLGIGGGNAAKINEAIEKLNVRNEILTEAIDRLTDAMENSSGAEAIRNYEKLVGYQKELEKNLAEQARLQASYHSAHGSFNKYWSEGEYNWSTGEYTNKAREMVDRFNSEKGMNLSYDLSNLNAEMAAAILESPDFVQLIKDTGKGGYGDRYLEKVKALAEQAGKLNEYTDKLYSSLTSVSFDNLYDSFRDTLMDMDSSAEDFASDFEKYMKQAMINALLDDVFKERLKAWRGAFAQFMKGDNKITDEERRRLFEIGGSYEDEGGQIVNFEGWKSISDSLLSARDELRGLWDESAISSADKSASAYAADKITYEQADQIEGQLTAIQISDEIRNQWLERIYGAIGLSQAGVSNATENPFSDMASIPVISQPMADGGMGQQIAAYLDTLNSIVSPNGTDVRDIRNMMITTNEYLLDIKKSNREMIQHFEERMTSMYNLVNDKL